MVSDANTKRLDCGGAVDIINKLPSNLIDLILKRLPVHDAAKLSILSKTWRDKWVMHPRLIFDHAFFNRLRFPFRSREIELYEFSRIISGILLAHSGPILKFCLYIPPDLPLHLYSNINFWIKNISNNGVRKVKLDNHSSSAYKIPSYLFSCSDLTHLDLNVCTLTPPPKFEGFRNLIRVRLVQVRITTDLSFGAQLNELDLYSCTGIEHLGCQFKHYINLTNLCIIDCGEIDWQWFECTRKWNVSDLMLHGTARKIIDLEKLVYNMPRIGSLHLDGPFLKFLQPGAAIMKRLIPTMEALTYLSLDNVEYYDLAQIQNIICLIRISPNLQHLIIDLGPKVESWNGMNLAESRELMVSSVIQYLQSPDLIGMIFNQLETVELYGVVDSAELQFIKLLLAFSPSLRWMQISNVIADPEEALRIWRELMRFSRASTTAEIIWL